MTIEERISEISRLSDEYMVVTRSIDEVLLRRNVIYREFVCAYAPDCRFESELSARAADAAYNDDEYVKLQGEWQSLTDRKDNIVKELELNRWRLLDAVLERAAAFPVRLFTGSLIGDIKH